MDVAYTSTEVICFFRIPLQIETKAGEQKYIPLELKTGKSNLNTEHATQVMLYCLALASRQVGTFFNFLNNSIKQTSVDFGFLLTEDNLHRNRTYRRWYGKIGFVFFKRTVEG